PPSFPPTVFGPRSSGTGRTASSRHGLGLGGGGERERGRAGGTEGGILVLPDGRVPLPVPRRPSAFDRAHSRRNSLLPREQLIAKERGTVIVFHTSLSSLFSS
ncbi:hypothetical protein Naga_100352g4, partial [Nannochloropsis gaditana]